MNLESIKIKNFRGYADEITIPISNLTAFIGKNDAGKSTILEALEIFFNNKIVEIAMNKTVLNSLFVLALGVSQNVFAGLDISPIQLFISEKNKQ